MHTRRLLAVLVALLALTLSGCATTSSSHAPYAPWLGQYDVGSVAFLDAHNKEVSTEQLLRAAVKKKFAKEGDAFLAKHPGMTKETFMKMMDVIITAQADKDNPVQRMRKRMADKLSDSLDGEPVVTLTDTSVRTLKKALLPNAHMDRAELVTATDVNYRLHDTDGTRALIATGKVDGKPAKLTLYVLGPDRLFLDFLPLIKGKEGKKIKKVTQLGVDKVGIVLRARAAK